MPKQENLPGMEVVDIRVRVPRNTRDKLNIIAAVRGITVNALLGAAIDDIIAGSEELKKLEQ